MISEQPLTLWVRNSSNWFSLIFCCLTLKRERNQLGENGVMENWGNKSQGE